MKRVALGLLALCLGAFGLSFWANRAPLPADHIALLTDRLMEFGAVDFVHDAYDGPETTLFDCVRAGRVLNAEQSARYRTAVQALLLDKQSLFARLDADLQLRRDAGMTQSNNIGGQGIAGLHDHHDLSALANLTDLQSALEQLNTAGPLRRAVLANDIYKDLVDLMVHMAPAVHSVGLIEGPVGPTEGDFNQFFSAMKAAQAAPLNSPAYWQAMDRAQSHYAALIETVQSQIRQHNGALLHALSGNWLALQTVAPRLSAQSPSTQDRRAGGPCTFP